MIRFLLILLLFSASNTTFASELPPLEQAKQDLSAGRYQAAFKNLRQLVAAEPRNYEAWFLYGVTHVHEQQYNQAIEAFRMVISLRPELAEPHNNLAAVYNNLGDTKAAVAELETALAKRPNYTVAEENLADLYIKLALQHYRNTLKLGPNPIIEERYARLIKVRNPLPEATGLAEAEQQEVDAATDTAVAKADDISSEKSPVPLPVTKAQTETEAKTEPVQVTATAQDSLPADDQTITGILDALEAWRIAWSAQNLDGYFSAYAMDYQPDKRFASISDWKAYKSRVIKNKTFIQINLEQVEVDIQDDKNLASVMMLQRFSSNSYKGNDFKRVSFKYTPDGWKITKEESIK